MNEDIDSTNTKSTICDEEACNGSERCLECTNKADDAVTGCTKDDPGSNPNLHLVYFGGANLSSQEAELIEYFLTSKEENMKCIVKKSTGGDFVATRVYLETTDGPDMEDKYLAATTLLLGQYMHLMKKKQQFNQDDHCPICFNDPFEVGISRCLLPCGHMICGECHYKIVNTTQGLIPGDLTCPICKEEYCC